MSLNAFFQSTLERLSAVTLAVAEPQWDYNPAQISADALTWPNSGTMPGHSLAAIGQSLVEYAGGPNATPCVRFSDHAHYEGTTDLGIVGSAPRTHLVLFKTEVTNNIEIMGWGFSDFNRLYDSMIYAGNLIQHFYGYEHYSANALRPNEWNAWLVRGTPLNATDLRLGMWLNGAYAETTAALNTGAGPLRLGTGHYENYPIDRRIARVLVWNRDLTDQEIAQVQSWVLATYGIVG